MSRPLAMPMAALALAMAAKDGRYLSAKVGAERLSERAARELSDHDGLRIAIDEFRDAIHTAGRFNNRPAVAQAGESLLQHLSMFSVPMPPGQERADLYG